MLDGYKCEGYAVYINGEQALVTPERSYLDAEILTLPIKANLGRCRIAIKMNSISPSGPA